MIHDNFEISSERDDIHFENSDEEISLPFINKIDVRIPFLDNKSESEEVSQDNNEGQSRFFFQDKKEESKSITKNICSSPRTNTKTKTKTEPLITKKDKIFLISKVNKKLGRLSNSSKIKKSAKHNKFFQDNIIQKIKVNFHEHIFNFVNLQYEDYLESKNEKITKLIERISPKGYVSIKIEDNLKWFSLKLRDILSSDLSYKFRKLDKNHNKRRIDALYSKNEAKNVINILEKTISEMYEIYSKNIFVNGFKTLNNDLTDLRNKMEANREEEENIQKYLKLYEKVAVNLKDIFSKKKPKQKGYKDYNKTIINCY